MRVNADHRSIQSLNVDIDIVPTGINDSIVTFPYSPRQISSPPPFQIELKFTSEKEHRIHRIYFMQRDLFDA